MQVRLLDWVPPPQCLLQAPQAPNGLQPPLIPEHIKCFILYKLYRVDFFGANRFTLRLFSNMIKELCHIDKITHYYYIVNMEVVVVSMMLMMITMIGDGYGW